MAYDSGELRGVGGWLGFFVVAFGLISPVVALISISTVLYGDPAIAAAYGDSWTTLQIFEWSLVIIAIAGIWYVVWRLLYVQTWTTVCLTIAAIWLFGPGTLIAESIGVAILLGVSPGEIFAVDPEFIRPFIFATIWTAYFLRSERVANTYPRASQADEMVETFR